MEIEINAAYTKEVENNYFFPLHFILWNYFIFFTQPASNSLYNLRAVHEFMFLTEFEINKVVVVFYLPRNLGGYTIEIAPEFER